MNSTVEDKYNFEIQSNFQGEFVQFEDTKMGPYNQIFSKEDTFYCHTKHLCRGGERFLFQPKNGSTELFNLQDDILIATLQRKNIKGNNTNFIDLIQLETHIKARFQVDGVKLFYNTIKDARELIVLVYELDNDEITLELDGKNLQELSRKRTNTKVHFNSIVQDNFKKYLEYVPIKNTFSNIEIDGYFILSDNDSKKDFCLIYKFPLKVIAEYYYKKITEPRYIKILLYASIFSFILMFYFLFQEVEYYNYISAIFTVIFFGFWLLTFDHYNKNISKIDFRNIFLLVNHTESDYFELPDLLTTDGLMRKKNGSYQECVSNRIYLKINLEKNNL